MSHPHPAVLHIVHLLGFHCTHGETSRSAVDTLHLLRLRSGLLELLVVRRSLVHLRRVLRLVEVEVRRLLLMVGGVLVDGGVVRDGRLRLLSRQGLVGWAREGEFTVRWDLRSRSRAARSAATTVLALSCRRRRDAGDGLAEEVGVDGLAANLMLLAMGVQVVFALEPTAAEVAFELVFGGVGATMAGEGGRVVESLAAEGSFADERTFVVAEREGRLGLDRLPRKEIWRKKANSLSTHVSLIAMARQENLSTHFAREGSSTAKARCVSPQDSKLPTRGTTTHTFSPLARSPCTLALCLLRSGALE